MLGIKDVILFLYKDIEKLQKKINKLKSPQIKKLIERNIEAKHKDIQQWEEEYKLYQIQRLI